MGINELLGWHKVDKCFPKESGYYKVLFDNHKQNWGVYDRNLDKWVDDCTEFRIDKIVYWRDNE